MRHAAFATVVLMLIGLTFIESQAQASRFEVASLRVVAAQNDGNPPTGFAANPRIMPGRVTWTTTLHSLTMYAYNLPAWRLLGIREEPHYITIAATTDAAATPDDVRAMLRQLLIDRFKLVTHTATEEQSGYALTVAKNGAKVQRALADGTPPPMPSYMGSNLLPGPYEGFIFQAYVADDVSAITGRGVPMSRLAEALSAHIKAFVLDQTGLTGRLYFSFRFQPIDYVSPEKPSRAASIFTALEEELGLKLERQRGPVEFRVVDSVEKVPTNN